MLLVRKSADRVASRLRAKKGKSTSPLHHLVVAGVPSTMIRVYPHTVGPDVDACLSVMIAQTCGPGRLGLSEEST